MKRRWFLVLGLGIIVANLGFLFAFDTTALNNSATAATNGILALGGVLMAIGGAGVQPRGTWYQFVGAGDVLIGIGMAASYLLPMVYGTSSYGSTESVFLVICAVAGGGSLAFMGFDWIRGGRQFDLSTFESGPILGSIRT